MSRGSKKTQDAGFSADLPLSRRNVRGSKKRQPGFQEETTRVLRRDNQGSKKRLPWFSEVFIGAQDVQNRVKCVGSFFDDQNSVR